LSSFAGNELLISPDRLIEDGLLRATDCEANSLPSAAIEYGAVIPYKRRMLEKAWATSVPERSHDCILILSSSATRIGFGWRITHSSEAKAQA
jgi:4-alpha-glucanotransferase